MAIGIFSTIKKWISGNFNTPPFVTSVEMLEDTAGGVLVTSEDGGNSASLIARSYSGGAVFKAELANGDSGTPLATDASNAKAFFGMGGWNGSAFTGSRASMRLSATETWTPSANGSKVEHYVTANGTTTSVLRSTITSVGLAVGVQVPAYSVDASGDIAATTAGFGLRVKEGSNAKMGLSVLSSGTVVVPTTAVTANSRIFLTSNVDGGVNPVGAVRVSARTAGTSFTITSSVATDGSSIAWMIVEPS